MEKTYTLITTWDYEKNCPKQDIIYMSQKNIDDYNNRHTAACCIARILNNKNPGSITEKDIYELRDSVTLNELLQKLLIYIADIKPIEPVFAGEARTKFSKPITEVK